jgi:hypothetical protein
MFFWIYDIPTWRLAILMIVFFVGTTWLGTLFLSPILKLWFRAQTNINELVGYFLSAFGVFYGLMLGTLAVATYQNTSSVEATVAREAASVGALYRTVSSYPEPTRTELTTRLRDYTKYIIDVSWPAQQKGGNPPGSVTMMNDFQRILTAYEPTTKGQELLHGEALRQYGDMILIRRQRIQSVGTGIPGTMWSVVAVGAILNIGLILCFRMRLDIHLVLGGILSFFVGMLIFLIAAMDYPFRGELSVGPDAFQLIYTSLMVP